MLSFLILHGRCAACRSPIPYWLPLVELAGAAGGIWVLGEIREFSQLTTLPATMVYGVALVLIASALVWIFFSDLVYGMVPDWAIIIGSAGAVIKVITDISIINIIVHLAAAGGAAAFFLLLVLLTRRHGMGTGDVTLSFLVGLLLGWPLVLVGLWLGFALGAIAGIILIVLKKKRLGQSIPFGPFLITGTLLASRYGVLALDSLFGIVK